MTDLERLRPWVSRIARSVMLGKNADDRESFHTILERFEREAAARALRSAADTGFFGDVETEELLARAKRIEGGGGDG